MIGIGITTRNRAQILDVVLKHFAAFTPNMDRLRFYIYNDTDNPERLAEYGDIIGKYPFARMESGPERLGIAGAKNMCIKALAHCDHVFLFDDDAFPKKAGWEDYYISTAHAAGVHHLMHLARFNEEEVFYRDARIFTYVNCMGVMLYFTRHALDVLGGYDPRFRTYGFEHAQISQRAYLAGLSGRHGPYISPVDTSDYIYSMDIDWNNFGVNPPLADLREVFFNSSLIGDEGKVEGFIDENRPYLGSAKTKMEI